MSQCVRTRHIQHREFRFSVEPEKPGQPAMLRCEAADPDLRPLCDVLECMWGRGPATLLESAAARTGRDVEGAAVYVYDKDFPDEPGEGVTAMFLDDEVSVTEGLFRELVIAFAEEGLALEGVGGLKIPEAAAARAALARLKSAASPLAP